MYRKQYFFGLRRFYVSHCRVRWSSGAAMLLIAAVVCGSPPAGMAEAVPEAVIESPVVEIGTVVEGEEVRHAFQVSNAGEAALEIADIQADCGCTTVDYDKVIAPGETGRIVAKVDTHGYGGRQLARQVRVTTNDPKHGRIDLILRFTVDRLMTLDPPIAKLEGAAGSPIQATVKVRPSERYPFQILEAAAKNGRYIDVRLSTEGPGEEGAYIVTVINRRREKGRYYDKVLLKTDSPHRSEISIDVFGRLM